MKPSALCFSLLVTTLTANASLILYDGFGGSSGSLEGQGGGTGWGGATWYNNIDGLANVNYGTPGLTYSTLDVSGNKAVTGGGDSGIFRYMGADRGSGTESYWISFVVQATGGAGSSYAGLSLFSGESTERLFIGQRNNQSVFGMERSGGSSGNSSSSSSSLSYLVARFDFTPSGESARLWVNPDLSGTPTDGTAAVTLTGLTDFTFDTVRIQSGSSTTFAFDEFRFGDTFADVTPVPEPIAMALLVFGILAVTIGGLRWARRSSGSISAATGAI